MTKPIRVSFEFFPPKTEEMEKSLWEAIGRLAPLSPNFVSVTYGAGGSTRERTHSTVKRIISETALTPAAHLTCVAATKPEIDAVIQSYRDAGVRHIVALRGDPTGGVGEKYADLDVFYPERMAQRILGMGDVLSLIEKVETEIDQKEAARLAERVAKDKFTLEDLRSQLQQVKKMGPLSSLVSMIPGAGKINEEDIDEKAIHRMQAILDSMTKKEREFPQLIDGKRKKRIAKGSGTTVQEINRLLKQYLQMKKMMRTFSKGMGARRFGKMMKGLPPEFLQ